MSLGGRGRNGAQHNVQRALGWQGGTSAVRTEVATCAICSAELRFFTGEYGQTLEQCTNRVCQGRHPHAPRPNPADLKPPYVAKSRRKTKEE